MKRIGGFVVVLVAVGVGLCACPGRAPVDEVDDGGEGEGEDRLPCAASPLDAATLTGAALDVIERCMAPTAFQLEAEPHFFTERFAPDVGAAAFVASVDADNANPGLCPRPESLPLCVAALAGPCESVFVHPTTVRGSSDLTREVLRPETGCGDLFAPRVLRDGCSSSRECVSGVCGGGRCVAHPAIGERCIDGECAANARCDGFGVCVDDRPGLACSAGSPTCRPDEFCPAESGASQCLPCTPENLCFNDENIVGEAIDAPCTSECAGGLVMQCSNGVCRPVEEEVEVVAVGGACDERSYCQDRFWLGNECDLSLPAPVCRAPGDIDSNCEFVRCEASCCYRSHTDAGDADVNTCHLEPELDPSEGSSNCVAGGRDRRLCTQCTP